MDADSVPEIIQVELLKLQGSDNFERRIKDSIVTELYNSLSNEDYPQILKLEIKFISFLEAIICVNIYFPK